MFLDVLIKTALEACGLKRNQPLLVGVSGGGDSLALMHGLNGLGFELVIAHLDHAIRPESAADGDYVQQLAESLGLRFVRERIDVIQAADEAGESLEEAARHVRYQFLFNQARLHQAQAVAVAHHADDQIETVLMHFMRGAALSGLSGMAYRRVLPVWDETIPLVRPLLGIWRDEIHDYLADVGLQPRVDKTNDDTTYFRNRIRRELIPQLETYNPQLRQVLWRMTEILLSEDEFLEDFAEEAWQSTFLNQGEGVVELHRLTFVDLPKALQRRILRRGMSYLRPDLRDVGFEAIERGICYAANPTQSGAVDLMGRLSLTVLGDVFVIKTWDAELPDSGLPMLESNTSKAELDLARVVSLRNGWCLTANNYPDGGSQALQDVRSLGENQVYLDKDQLALPLTVRGRRSGDRWQPLGLRNHTQSLKDFFINEKVPEHLRDLWPLVCSGEEIIWVVGLRPSEMCKITPETQHILHLCLIKSA